MTAEIINPESSEVELKDKSKRDFLVGTACAMTGVSLACIALPLVDSMNPSADVSALSSIEVDLSAIKVGEEKKVMWQGKPVFVRRRTKSEIEKAEQVSISELKDPEPDSARVKPKKEEWLIAIGICTHLGCIPISGKGDFGGWFCPCHGSHYDTSGRIRKGPAPKNLKIPPYQFVGDSKIKIG